jgi:hypothetical protein
LHEYPKDIRQPFYMATRGEAHGEKLSPPSDRRRQCVQGSGRRRRSQATQSGAKGPSAHRDSLGARNRSAMVAYLLFCKNGEGKRGFAGGFFTFYRWQCENEVVGTRHKPTASPAATCCGGSEGPPGGKGAHTVKRLTGGPLGQFEHDWVGYSSGPITLAPG